MTAIEEAGSYDQPTVHPARPPIETPNFDRLAARGAVFPEGHTGAPKCGPSVRSTLTGKHPRDYLHRFGPTPDERILPEYLADLGYVSFGFGKIWGGDFEDQGFTEGGLKSNRLTHETVAPLLDWLDSRVVDDRPWFAFYMPKLPHRPFNAPPEYKALFDDPIYQGLRGYYANIALLDDFLGEVLDTLEVDGLDATTMIVLLTDNGYGLPTSKSSPGENGVRSPILVSWPSHIDAGLVLPQLVHATDLLPTILDYAGETIDPDGTLPDAYPETVSGISLRSALEGGPMAPGREYLFGHDRPGGVPYLLTEGGRMRLTRTLSGRYLLFDLWDNPDEARNRDLYDSPLYADDVPVWKSALEDWWLR